MVPGIVPPKSNPTPPSQLALFPSAPVPSLESRYEGLRSIAAALPAGVRFGTSSWSFPGWKGIVWAAGHTPSELSREGLAEYVRHPLLTTVGIDATFYARQSSERWRAWASQVPADFSACIKAPASVTSAVLRDQGRVIGANADFLSPARFAADLGDDLSVDFAAHVGVVLLEISPVPPKYTLSPSAFVARLDGLLGQLPPQFAYAVELREPTFLTWGYRDMLARRKVGHVYSYWSRMPPLEEQLAVVPLGDAPHTVIRLLLPPGADYEAQREAWTPFAAIQQPDPGMRSTVLRLIREGTGYGKTFVLVNNKAEGSAPLTIEAIAQQLALELSGTERREPRVVPDPGAGDPVSRRG